MDPPLLQSIPLSAMQPTLRDSVNVVQKHDFNNMFNKADLYLVNSINV